MNKEIYQESVPDNTYDCDEQATIGGYRDGPPTRLAVIKLDKNDQKPNQQSQK